MALGIARIFGIKLPQISIRRCAVQHHRFLAALAHDPDTFSDRLPLQPLALRVTRRRMAKGLQGFGGRNTTAGAYFSLLLLPTLFTMCVSGLWHGAGYLFILWGALHGIYLSINHAWRLLARKLWPDKVKYARIMTTGWARVDVRIRGRVHGVLSRIEYACRYGNPSRHVRAERHCCAQSPAARSRIAGSWLQHLGVAISSADFPFTFMVLWLLALGVIVFFCPNTQEIMARYEPALGVRAQDPSGASLLRRISWRPSIAWSLIVATMAVIGILQLAGPSEFLYWQF